MQALPVAHTTPSARAVTSQWSTAPRRASAVTCRVTGSEQHSVSHMERSSKRNSDRVPFAAVTPTARAGPVLLGTEVPTPLVAAVALGGAALGLRAIKKVFDTPSRTYDGQNVGKEYDAWTREGILEHYWGEHIHLGYYTEEEQAAGYKKKDFIQAKHDFVDRMIQFAGVSNPGSILDVGCGIGGTTRMLASRFPGAKVAGITLSPNQVARGTALAAEKGLANCEFKVMDALKMDYPDNSFDVVWACESGEHMPDKGAYVREMVRVLKPGGTLVIATWCQREVTPANPFTASDKERLQFLYDEWAHPYFISKEEYGRLVQGTGVMEAAHLEDWAKYTLPSWRHSIWVGVYDPWIVVSKPHLWYKCARDGVTLERFHRAFVDGLVQYGMIRAVKKKAAA
ncbi:VTE6 [Auxenochlorella protothecoides x Auxenochlorella symbiontica]